jgi:hypothetical protein
MRRRLDVIEARGGWFRWALLAVALAGSWALPGAHAKAQRERVVVLVIDAGSMRVNADSIGRAIEGALRRPVVRMTDERAQRATGRLTIAFSNPNRWVLRYEAEGQVAWVSDRILRPGALRSRLVELSQGLVTRLEGSSPERRRAWNEDVILALQNEIVDPFRDDPPRARPRPITVLWSEVVDPFRDQPARARVTEVWSEVLDPWASEVRR